MQFNVAQLLLEPIGSTRDFSVELDYTEAQQNLLNFHGASGSVRMIRTHRGILVRALFHVQTCLNCGRCLADYMWNSSIDIEEEFLPEFDLVTGRSVDIEPEEDALFHIDGDHILDLTEALRRNCSDSRGFEGLRFENRGRIPVWEAQADGNQTAFDQFDPPNLNFYA